MALENSKKKDYISLVANSIPLDMNSDEDRYDSEYQAQSYLSESALKPNMQSI